MSFKLGIIVIALVVLQGCASTGNKAADPDAPPTIVDKLVEFQNDTTALNLNPVELLFRLFSFSGVTTNEGMPGFKKTWCVSNLAESQQAARDMISAHCSELGGEYDGSWCKALELEQPLFQAVVGNSRLVYDSGIQCSVGSDIAVVATTGEGADQESWQSIARGSLNFRTQSEIDFNRRQARQRAEARARDEADKRQTNAMLIYASGVGARICQELPNGVRYAGFVEVFQNNRMRVSVISARNSSAPWTTTGFQPVTIWDIPENWFIC